MRRILFGLLMIVLVAASGAAVAQASTRKGERTVSVTITNTTSHQTFSAPVLVAHNKDYEPFALGKPVLPELIPLAEDGMTHDFETVAKVEPSILDYTVAEGPLAPGQSVTLQVRVDDGHMLLSAFGMLVTTNDAVFFYGNDLSMSGTMSGGAMASGSASMGASDAMASGSTGSDSMGSSDSVGASDSMAGDSMAKGAMSSDTMSSDTMSGEAMSNSATAGSSMSGDAMNDHVDLYDGTVRVLDAGSEANTESCHDVPGPPCNSVGVRHPSMAEGIVSLHKGLTGTGDLDPSVYGWDSPVARVTLSTP